VSAPLTYALADATPYALAAGAALMLYALHTGDAPTAVAGAILFNASRDSIGHGKVLTGSRYASNRQRLPLHPNQGIPADPTHPERNAAYRVDHVLSNAFTIALTALIHPLLPVAMIAAHWSGGVDVLYYPLRLAPGFRSFKVVDWMWWTPWGLVRSATEGRKARIKGSTALLQGLAGLAAAIVITAYLR
jgi:hypothetical protein